MRFAIVILLLSCTPVFATELHEGDIELAVGGGQIVTENGRVFESEFGEAGPPNETDEPGFDNELGTFPGGSTIGFSILDSLRKWDGTDFDTIPTETLSVSFGTSLGPITTPGTPGVVPGFDVGVDSDGTWHRHYDFLLNAPASTGIYLLQIQLESSDPGIAPTEPFFIVFNQDDTELNHEAAAAFIEASLVPEPSTVAMWLLGAMMLVARGRRR